MSVSFRGCQAANAAFSSLTKPKRSHFDHSCPLLEARACVRARACAREEAAGNRESTLRGDAAQTKTLGRNSRPMPATSTRARAAT